MLVYFNLILEYLSRGKVKLRFIEYLYFWMLKPYSVNLQKSLVDFTGTLPKEKKITKKRQSISVSFARQSYCQLTVLCVSGF